MRIYLLSVLFLLALTLSPLARATLPSPEELAGCREELIFQIVRPNLAHMLRTMRALRALVAKLDVPPAQIPTALAQNLETIEITARELRRVQEVTRGILQDALKSRVSKRKEQTDELIHDLGNLLSPVGYAIAVLKAQPHIDGKEHGMLRTTINTGLQKGESLIRERITPVISEAKFVAQKTPINVNDILTPVQALHRLSDPPVNVEIDGESLTIVANDLDIFTAVSNLCLNAQEAITTQLNGRGRVIARAYRIGQYVVIEVKDNGPGVPKDAQTRLLQRNQSNKGDGRGVGLSSVQRNVFDNDGEFFFLSETEGPNRGTTFQLRFPFFETNAAEK